MATRVSFEPLFSFRFHARFWKGCVPTGEPINLDFGFTLMEVGAKHCGVRQTPLGLEVWTAHRVGQPMLYQQIWEAKSIEVVLFAPDPKQKSRVILMNIDNPKCLPFRLDAMDSSVAMDGVLFEETGIIAIMDEVREWPPESKDE